MKKEDFKSKFILKRDVPFLKAGADFKYSNYYNRFVCCDDVGGTFDYSYDDLNNNKHWFEKVIMK